MNRKRFIAILSSFPFLAMLWPGKQQARDTAMPEYGESDAILLAIGESSMCWEHPHRGGEFQTDRAIEIGERLRQHFADGIGDFATARRRVCDDMAKDEGLYLCYHANIAMSLYDNTVLSRKTCNQQADILMKLLFEA